MLRANPAFALFALLGVVSCGLADRPTIPHTAPLGAKAPLPATSVTTQLAFGTAHGCALLEGGRVRCWGENALGQLGLPSNGSAMALAPAEVPGLRNVVGLAARSSATCALVADGRVSCWGDRMSGIPPGVEANGRGPSTIGGLGPMRSIALGYGDYGCVALRTGEVGCWGRNSHGRVAPGAPPTADLAPRVVPGVAGAAQVAAGLDFTCARLEAGSVQCWGSNAQGQLGDGTREDRAAPVTVAGVDDAVDLSTSPDHACVVRRSGRVTCWGANNVGQLGGKDEAVRNGPFTHPQPDDTERVSAGSGLTCVVRKGGKVRCWGDTSFGQASAGATGLDPSAKLVTDVPGVEGASAVGAAGLTACALRGRELLCWGANVHGLFGNGSAAQVRRPARVPLGGPAVDVVAGRGASCALLKDGRVQCWGEGVITTDWPAGEAKAPWSARPEFVAGLEGVKALFTDGTHLCARRERDADPLCMMMGVFPYASGPKPYDTIRRPATAKGLGHITSMTRELFGGEWALATREGGALVSVSLKEKLRGDGSRGLEARARSLKGAPSASRVAGAAEGPYACALYRGAGQKVGCFGAKSDSFASPELVGKPKPVEGLNDAVDVAVSGANACAVRAKGAVACWRRPESPDDAPAAAEPPEALAGLEPVAQLAFAPELDGNACALAKGGKVYCYSTYAADAYGLLCTGALRQAAPAACPDVDDGVKLAMGNEHACVLHKGGDVSCWGNNLTGAVGPSGIARSDAPVVSPL